MTEVHFRVNGRLAAMAGALHTVASAFIEQARDSHVTPTVLGLASDGKTTFVHLRCPGEEIDARREALFRDELGTRFIAAVFICEAWSLVRSGSEVPQIEPRTAPDKLEVVVFDGRDAQGNQLRARALINRDAGAGLMPLEYLPPANFAYHPSSSETVE